ncbi:50S ribosomal protein L25/general stress protein Ctc [Dermatophilus congolensis]|uniref:Large ribosomal subunit protein bL25 n=1 Tax=Dermatophilus congolensis TaxID=1863 RepID=A0A239VUA2_9MICO|nr:50S ribosomal protein L25/general stress protein Ctc [Dermatophilus congolensis]MBO3129895.1 50S ribosomal protein L25/general stress protein Ctc [Dermatophilus congolensis]MBO3131475.1 50S ribosomal protein L25/general stress protein Ctc [Dermatophilus congolensis]MBO3134369.1 50S ribosomal protein L25/general stress protein Ctc [Dermatophilus congolensis]MBO3136604.1 50S ribosomal protein L25/general stress protein Ctc [Dermatophilus congolensis]MBO3138848.1 50S ribosomal protein L25/gene
MSDSIRIEAEARSQFGKGAARSIRRASKIPAVIYGGGEAPVHVVLPGHDTMMATKTANALLTVVLDGQEHLCLVKDIQRFPIRPEIVHVDLVRVKKGEKVSVDVSITVTGEAAPETYVDLDANTLTVLAPATDIPENVEIDVTDAAVGTQIFAKDIKLPAGVELETDAETLVVNVTAATTAEQLEAELEEAEAEAGIEKDEPEAAEDDKQE